eukprot:15971803-Heterocapsa_arctica.AAC.1
MVQDGTVVDLVAGGCALADRPVPSDTFVQAHGLGTRRQFIFGSPGLATRLITADTDPENAYKVHHPVWACISAPPGGAGINQLRKPRPFPSLRQMSKDEATAYRGRLE